MINTKQLARAESRKRKLEALLRLSNTMKLNEPSHICKSAVSADVKANNEVEPSSNQPDKMRKADMTAEELDKLRAELRLRQKAAMQLPKLYLTVEKLGQSANEFVQCPSDLFIFDVQHLLLYALQGGVASYKPRWCKLLRHEKLSHIVVIIVEAVGATDFATFPECFPFLIDTFPMNVELVCPSQYGQTVASELFRVPVSVRRMKRLKHTTTGGEKRPFENKDETEDGALEVPPVKRIRVDDAPVSRVSLLMSREQMVRDGYPLPYSQSEKTKNYLFTKKTYRPVTEKSPLFAIDCEMCETDAGRNELTRVAVVNGQRECVYETLVKPRNQITNYLTKFSGITRKMLKHVHTRIEEVQRQLQQLLPSDAILVGHSLNFDLDALQLMHPYVIDTSVCLNRSINPGRKPSLKLLALQILGKEIQVSGSEGHDPHEDALAALDLVLHRLQKDDDNSKNGSLPVGQNSEAVSTLSENTNPDMYKPEGSSDDCQADQPYVEQPDIVKKQTENDNVSALSQIQSDRTAANAAFYFRPGTDCYESFGDVIGNANKTMAAVGFSSPVECSGDAVEHVSADCDRNVVRCCRDAVNRHFVVCAQFSDIRTECEQRRHSCPSSHSTCLQTLMRKTDKRLRKLISSLESRALAIVLFAGGSRGDAEPNQKTVCFVQVT